PAAWNNGSSSFADLEARRSASGKAAKSLSSDPGFLDPDRGDFRLQAGSGYAHAGTSRTAADASAGYDGLPPAPGIQPRPGDKSHVGYPSGAPPVSDAKPGAPINLPAREYDPIPD